jgi:hypothetical protein
MALRTTDRLTSFIPLSMKRKQRSSPTWRSASPFAWKLPKNRRWLGCRTAEGALRHPGDPDHDGPIVTLSVAVRVPE